MYVSFAYGYDKIMSSLDYHKFINYYKSIFNKFSIKPELILDLGCGTGNLTALMADCGYDMIGIDLSAEMLDIASKKNSRENILYLNQDMRNFELYGTVDVIYSALDCINYITLKNDLKKVFKLAYNYLNPNGLFIFDINTEYYFKNIIDKNTFIYDIDDIYMIWQNEYDKKTKLCGFFIDMFYKNENKYERFYEEHFERAYKLKDLKDLLEKSSFENIGIYDEFSFKNIKQNTKRAFFIARRTK